MVAIEEKKLSFDGSKKYLLRAGEEENLFEAVVFKTDGSESEKYSVCISTQIGCKMQCLFCATSHIGYKRGLTANEISEGLHIILKDTGIDKTRLNYVALMGMGEPLDNYSETVGFLDFAHESGFKRVSLSTVGIPSGIIALSKTAYPPLLFVSLHFTEDDQRREYMPAAGKYTISELIGACREYYCATFGKIGQKVRISYMLIKGVNDSEADAERLCGLLSPDIFKINLLRYNPNGFSDFFPPEAETVEKFRKILISKGFETAYRPSRGTDIGGGCGQLVGKKIKNDG